MSKIEKADKAMLDGAGCALGLVSTGLWCYLLGQVLIATQMPLVVWAVFWIYVATRIGASAVATFSALGRAAGSTD